MRVDNVIDGVWILMFTIHIHCSPFTETFRVYAIIIITQCTILCGKHICSESEKKLFLFSHVTLSNSFLYAKTLMAFVNWIYEDATLYYRLTDIHRFTIVNDLRVDHQVDG